MNGKMEGQQIGVNLSGTLFASKSVNFVGEEDWVLHKSSQKRPDAWNHLYFAVFDKLCCHGNKSSNSSKILIPPEEKK